MTSPGSRFFFLLSVICNTLSDVKRKAKAAVAKRLQTKKTLLKQTECLSPLIKRGFVTGSRTPHYGSQTPLHDGSRTPGQSGAWDPNNPNTPSR